MVQKAIRSFLFIGVVSISVAQGQQNQDSVYRRFYVGSSAFMLWNFAVDPPSFYQLNFGYRITPRDVISIEAITWRYSAPLGIPYGASYGSKSEDYPGTIREYGMGVVYQRFLWKNLYSSLQMVPFRRLYRDENNNTIQKGFQLFMTLRLGYHVPLFKNRFFIEPSLAATHWPLSTNVPEGFAEKDKKWPNYFLLEPGLHFGIKF